MKEMMGALAKLNAEVANWGGSADRGRLERVWAAIDGFEMSFTKVDSFEPLAHAGDLAGYLRIESGLETEFRLKFADAFQVACDAVELLGRRMSEGSHLRTDEAVLLPILTTYLTRSFIAGFGLAIRGRYAECTPFIRQIVETLYHAGIVATEPGAARDWATHQKDSVTARRPSEEWKARFERNKARGVSEVRRDQLKDLYAMGSSGTHVSLFRGRESVGISDGELSMLLMDTNAAHSLAAVVLLLRLASVSLLELNIAFAQAGLAPDMTEHANELSDQVDKLAVKYRPLLVTQNGS